MSKIEWTQKTWNPVTGCTKVSPGCDNCYAEKMAHRLQKMCPQKYALGFDVALHPGCLEEPLRRKKPTVFFVCSMGDLFHEDIPAPFIADVYSVMALCPQHTFIVLTKRPARMARFIESFKAGSVLDGLMIGSDVITFDSSFSHVYHGATICNQGEADMSIPQLLQVPGKRFLSIEPMLGLIDLMDVKGTNCLTTWKYYTGDHLADNMIHQVILGGESGPHARPMRHDWVRSVRDQCEAYGVSFMFKQWGEWLRWQDAIDLEPMPLGQYKTHRWSDCLGDFSIRVGKKKAGRLLDGQLHDELIWRGNE